MQSCSLWKSWRFWSSLFSVCLQDNSEQDSGMGGNEWISPYSLPIPIPIPILSSNSHPSSRHSTLVAGVSFCFSSMSLFHQLQTVLRVLLWNALSFISDICFLFLSLRANRGCVVTCRGYRFFSGNGLETSAASSAPERKIELCTYVDTKFVLLITNFHRFPWICFIIYFSSLSSSSSSLSSLFLRTLTFTLPDLWHFYINIRSIYSSR